MIHRKSCPGHFHILPIARALPDFSIYVKFYQRRRHSDGSGKFFQHYQNFPALPKNGVYSILYTVYTNMRSRTYVRQNFQTIQNFQTCIQYAVYGLPSTAAHDSEAAQSLKFQEILRILRFDGSCCADARRVKKLRKSYDGQLSFRFSELRSFSRRKRAANLTFLVKFFNYFLKILRFCKKKFDF